MIMSKTSPFQISVCTAHRTISRGRLQQNLTDETSAYQQAISGSQRTGIAGTRKTANKRRLCNARSTPWAAKLPLPYGRKKPCVQGRKTAARRGRSIARHRRFEPFRFQTDSQPLSDSKKRQSSPAKKYPLFARGSHCVGSQRGPMGPRRRRERTRAAGCASAPLAFL